VLCKSYVDNDLAPLGLWHCFACVVLRQRRYGRGDIAHEIQQRFKGQGEVEVAAFVPRLVALTGGAVRVEREVYKIAQSEPVDW
jgi:hypothetical protein